MRNNKWNLTKLKSFCMARNTIILTKQQAIEWEKIFTNYIYLDIFKKKTTSKYWTSRNQITQFKNGVQI